MYCENSAHVVPCIISHLRMWIGSIRGMKGLKKSHISLKAGAVYLQLRLRCKIPSAEVEDKVVYFYRIRNVIVNGS